MTNEEGGRVTERERRVHVDRVSEELLHGEIVPEAVAGEAVDYRWVYLWRWPLRMTHWAAAITITMLVITGFYIGKPYFMTGGEASSHFMMGWARFLHFASAGLLVAAAIVRVYWLFAGKKYAKWTALFPVSGRDWGPMARAERRARSGELLASDSQPLADFDAGELAPADESKA